MVFRSVRNSFPASVATWAFRVVPGMSPKIMGLAGSDLIFAAVVLAGH
jgi:hypothetical protein